VKLNKAYGGDLSLPECYIVLTTEHLPIEEHVASVFRV